MTILSGAVRQLIKVMLLVFWTIIGLLFWIPLLARMTVYFGFMVIASTFTDANLAGARVGLDFAINFYALGFKKIISTLSGPTPDGNTVGSPALPDPAKIAWETLYTLVFWVLTVGAIASFFRTPTIEAPEIKANDSSASSPQDLGEITYVTVKEVQEKLDCDGAYTNEQRGLIFAGYANKRVKFRETIAKVYAKDNVIELDGNRLTKHTPALFQDEPRAVPRDRGVYTNIRKGAYYMFDCKIAKYCKDYVEDASLVFEDCVIE